MSALIDRLTQEAEDRYLTKYGRDSDAFHVAVAQALRTLQLEAAKVARGHWPKCCDEDRDEYAEVAEEIAAKIEAL